jgi:hypothetical protein
MIFQTPGPVTSTPRKPSTPYQLWREEHMKQEFGAVKSAIGKDTEMRRKQI